MSASLRSNGTAGLLAVLAFSAYVAGNSSAPPASAEVAILTQAQVLATGPWRLFFQVSADQWLQPAAVYATWVAAFVVPFEQSARVASAAIAALSVALLYLLVRREDRRAWIAVTATVLFALTPALFTLARAGVDAVYALPFVLLWLITIRDTLDRVATRRLAAAALVLGLGIYTQPSAPLTMAFLLAVGLGAIWISGVRSPGTYAAVVAAFAVPWLAAAVWFADHLQSYPDTFGRWAVHLAHVRNPLDGLSAFVNWNTLGQRTSLYWGFFDPSWLFFDGPAAPNTLFREFAPFLFVTVILLALGMTRCVRQGRPAWAFTLLVGLAVVPLAASTFGQPHAIADAAASVPFVVVIAAGGIAELTERTGVPWRVLGSATAALGVIGMLRYYAAYLAW